MIKNTGLFILILGVISACTFRTNIHFNEDWSGNLEYVLDMSETVAIMDDSTERVSLLDDPEMEFSVEDYEKMDGISNVQLNEDIDGGIYSLSLDFADTKALNHLISNDNTFGVMLGTEDAVEGESSLNFELKKNKLAVNMPNLAGLNEAMAADNSEVIRMGDFIQYEINVTFDRKVKKFKTKGITEQIGFNKIQFKSSLGQFDELMETSQSVKLVLE